MAKFTKADLKPGYVVALRSGLLGMIMPWDTDSDLVIAYRDARTRDGFDVLRSYRDDLTYIYDDTSVDIVKVYGYSKLVQKTLDITRDYRELLWDRAPKKMTVKEICDALGYNVEIVKEDDSDA